MQSILEIIGLGAILPVFLAILEPDIIQKYDWAHFLYTTLNLSNTNELIIILTIILSFAFIIKSVISIMITKARTDFSYSIYKNIALKSYEKFYFRDYQFIKAISTAEHWRNLNQSINWFSVNQLIPTLVIINEIIIFIIIISLLFYYNSVAMFVLGLTTIPIIYLITIWIKNKTIFIANKKKEADPLVLLNYQESILGYIDVVVTGSQKFFKNKTENVIKRQIKYDTDLLIMNEIPVRAIETTLIITISIITIYGVLVNMHHSSFLTLLGMIGLAGYRLAPTINRISMNLKTIAQFSWTTDIILKQINFKVQKNINEKINFNKSISLESISFAFENQKEIILKNLCIDIKKGETIGIIGESGSGKTTLLNIILGLISPTEGKILIDGIELKNSQIIDYRSKIGYVGQNLFIINDSIARNIAFGVSDDLINHKKLKASLKLANLWEFVKSSKLGLDTKLSENGNNLSGGQRQRIGIARAIYSDAEILLFDEATSSLDQETEKKITKSIAQLTKNHYTVIIISHNKASLKYCERIIDIKACQKK